MPKRKEMEFYEITYGANQGAKKFTIAVKKGMEVEKPDSGVLEWIAKHSVLRYPRSYESDRTNQSLRHLATAAKVYLDLKGLTDYQEVQAAFTKSGKFIISSNSNRANKELREFFEGQTIEQISKTLTKNVKYKSQETDIDTYSRENRHLKKFSDKDRLKTAFGSGTKGKISVPDDVKPERDGLHAELRIKEAGDDDVDIQHIKGIKRPCAHCFAALKLPPPKDGGPGQGPEWPSRAAKLSGVTPSTGVTRITIKKISKKPTVDYDTESESEAEDKPKLGGPKKPKKLKADKSVLASGETITKPASPPLKKQKKNSFRSSAAFSKEEEYLSDSESGSESA
jgi:hypothetical protein